MRSHGEVRFLRVSGSLQRRIAAYGVAAIAVWLIATLAMAIGQWRVSAEQARLAATRASVATAAERVAAYRQSISEVARDLNARQSLLETLHRQHFADPPARAATPAADPASQKIGAAVPEAAPLATIEARQLRLAAALTRVAQSRAARAEAKLRSFGLDPRQRARPIALGQGGPFVPFRPRLAAVRDARFLTLADTLARMETLERTVAAMPSSMPASVPALSSGFGYRRDPFTGAAAMHAGLDFRGPLGSPILAAASGKVSFVGTRAGYGQVVEIAHAAGVVTRYAHLSGFAVRPGQAVARGQMVARMGSTGRSTGSHLHFEVRIDGVAVNPARFLKDRHVL